MPQLNFRSGLQNPQYQSIQNLINSGRTLNETDARNLGYATNTSNWQQFVGQSSSNYSIGNLAQYLPNSTPNINSNNLSSNALPNLGQSSFPSFFNNVITTGMTQTELGLQNYLSQRESIRADKEKNAQKKYDEALAGLEGAYNQPSGADLLKGYMAEYDIEGKIKQLSEFQNQLVALQGAYQSAVNDIGNKPINAAIIRGQQYLKEQEYAGKATVLQAQAAIVQDQFNMAKDIVSTYYDVAMADRANTIKRYETLLGLAKDDLVTLDAEEKENINMFIGNLQAMDERQRAEKDKIAELMLDPVAQVAFKNTPGLDLNMSYNDIVQNLLPQMAAENMRRYNLENTPRGGGGSGLGSAVTGLGITGKNLNSDMDTIARNFAAMGTNLTDSLYRQAVYSLLDTYNYDNSSMGAGSDYEMVSNDLNRAIQRYRTDTVNQPSNNMPSGGGNNQNNNVSNWGSFDFFNPNRSVNKPRPTWEGYKELFNPVSAFNTVFKKKK